MMTSWKACRLVWRARTLTPSRAVSRTPWTAPFVVISEFATPAPLVHGRLDQRQAIARRSHARPLPGVSLGAIPIQPGEAKVVAMDPSSAGSQSSPVGPFRAPEEFWTEADVENPFAVNMVRVYGGTAGIFGRGRGFFVTAQQAVQKRSRSEWHRILGARVPRQTARSHRPRVGDVPCAPGTNERRSETSWMNMRSLGGRPTDERSSRTRIRPRLRSYRHRR